MVRRIVFALALLAMPRVAAAADEGAGVEALQFYVGEWSEDGVSRADPAADFTPLHGHEYCSWIDGGAAVACHESVTDVSGTSDALYVLQFDATRQLYTVQGTDYATSGILLATGKPEGGIWTWDATFTVGEEETPLRFVFHSTPAGRDLLVTTPDAQGQQVELQKVAYTRK